MGGPGQASLNVATQGRPPQTPVPGVLPRGRPEDNGLTQPPPKPLNQELAGEDSPDPMQPGRWARGRSPLSVVGPLPGAHRSPVQRLRIWHIKGSPPGSAGPCPACIMAQGKGDGVRVGVGRLEWGLHPRPCGTGRGPSGQGRLENVRARLTRDRHC
ncbi:hypothetical protein NDU88_008115 [Pleurodeles waltl]|uniref:Uncharacterized protein n=1 Tax=Pleurodeles waltl TaxID=8319 RepID=A0AAV7VSA4_PLEWA|nr:hypothetical protein NDU88_008115 [Pleurodeles waltl]